MRASAPAATPEPRRLGDRASHEHRARPVAHAQAVAQAERDGVRARERRCELDAGEILRAVDAQRRRCVDEPPSLGDDLVERRRDDHRSELALGEVVGQRGTGERADLERRQALHHDLGDPLVVRRGERTDRVDDDVATVEVVTELARAFAHVDRRHREDEEARFVREPTRHRSSASSGGGKTRGGQARAMARARDRVDDRGVARPQDHAATRAREHRGERGAERAGADDADGVVRACSRLRSLAAGCAPCGSDSRRAASRRRPAAMSPLRARPPARV